MGTALPEDQDGISKGKQSLRKTGNLQAPAVPDAQVGRRGRPDGTAGSGSCRPACEIKGQGPEGTHY